MQLATYELVEDSQIIAEVQEQNASEESEGEDDPDIFREKVPAAKAFDCFDTLKLFATQSDGETEETFKSLYVVEEFLNKKVLKSLKQSKIQDYFSAK